MGLAFYPPQRTGGLRPAGGVKFPDIRSTRRGHPGCAPRGVRSPSVTLDQVRLIGNSFPGLNWKGTGIVAGTMRQSTAAETEYGVYTRRQARSISRSKSRASSPTWCMASQTDSAGSVLNVGASTIGGNGRGYKPLGQHHLLRQQPDQRQRQRRKLTSTSTKRCDSAAGPAR